MSIIDKTVEANRQFAKGYDRRLGARPAPKIAVVTCMDPRLSDLSGILGLPQADIDVILDKRNIPKHLQDRDVPQWPRPRRRSSFARPSRHPARPIRPRRPGLGPSWAGRSTDRSMQIR